MSTDSIIDLPNSPGCSFCKTARGTRAYCFVNPDRDFIICDVCVIALAQKLASIGDPEPYRPQGKPN